MQCLFTNLAPRTARRVGVGAACEYQIVMQQQHANKVVTFFLDSHHRITRNYTVCLAAQSCLLLLLQLVIIIIIITITIIHSTIFIMLSSTARNDLYCVGWGVKHSLRREVHFGSSERMSVSTNSQAMQAANLIFESACRLP